MMSDMKITSTLMELNRLLYIIWLPLLHVEDIDGNIGRMYLLEEHGRW